MTPAMLEAMQELKEGISADYYDSPREQARMNRTWPWWLVAQTAAKTVKTLATSPSLKECKRALMVFVPDLPHNEMDELRDDLELWVQESYPTARVVWGSKVQR